MDARWAVLALCLGWAAPVRALDSFESALNEGFHAVSAPADEEEEAGAPVDPASLPDRVDLTRYWSDGPRDQNGLRACHTFAAVGLLEAAYYRLTGRRQRLSEADLFARATALRGPRSAVVRENGLLREDLEIALETGVAPGDWYAALKARYASFPRWDPPKSRRERFEELLPEAAAPEAAAGRERVRAELSSVSLEGESLWRYAGTAVRTMAKGGGVSCRVKAKRRDRIMRRLAAGIPLGAGLLLNGVSDAALNAQRDSVGGQHYVILTGYERRADGVVFSIRNSWGTRPGWDAVLTEGDLCALFALSWAALPGDRR